MSLADLYRDLHQHPELSFQETRTAAIAAERLRAAGAGGRAHLVRGVAALVAAARHWLPTSS